MIILSVLCAILITGCATNAPGTSNSSSDSSANSSTGAESDKPVIKKRTSIDSGGSYRITEYDIDGKELKEVAYDSDGNAREVSLCVYDENGNLLSDITTNAGGMVLFGEVWEYTDFGEILNRYSYDDTGRKVLREVNEFNSDNLKVKSIINDYKGLFSQYNLYTYDKDKRLIREEIYSKNDYLLRTYAYEYAEEGYLCKKTDSDHNYDDIYVYDEEGNVLRQTLYFKGDVSFIIVNEYGPYGVSDSFSYDGDGSFRYHKKYTYDDSGKLLSNIEVDEDGNENKAHGTHFKYDRAGNIVERTSERGYEFYARYNKYGDPVWIHDICKDMMRNAGTYDIETSFEYEYY